MAAERMRREGDNWRKNMQDEKRMAGVVLIKPIYRNVEQKWMKTDG